MKIIDRYITKNFLVGYAIAFFVLIGLRVIIDLFINLDEFTENADAGAIEVIKNVVIFYGINATVFFRDFSGMIIVVAAAFSLGRMVRCNELVAIMASGMSLKRVIAPIVVISIILTVLLVIDQEVLIPSLSDKLVRGHDTKIGQESYGVWFVTDEHGSLINSRKFDVATAAMENPTIITREYNKKLNLWNVTGRIDAEKAVYDPQKKGWTLENAYYIAKEAKSIPRKATFYKSDLTARDVPVRSKASNKTFMSSRQLSILASQPTKIKDLADLFSQKHFRITEPIMNIVMLLISLPLLVCRDPKAMKSAIMTSFSLTGACMILNFICRLVATEEYLFNRVLPEFWAWLPIFIFLPIAIIEIDSMKT
jgi:lipopolysaccharide export system permease protein